MRRKKTKLDFQLVSSAGFNPVMTNKELTLYLNGSERKFTLNCFQKRELMFRLFNNLYLVIRNFIIFSHAKIRNTERVPLQ